MKSSRSRSRSKNNRNRNTSNQGGNVVNRVFDSSGPEGKVRGTPQQVIEKYNQLARDAQLSNDRVAMENFQQHAEHYLRLLSEAQREMDAKREEQERQNRERQAEQDAKREEQERLHRERQAERDRERAERQEREEGNTADQEGKQDTRQKGDEPQHAEQPVPPQHDKGSQPQPEVNADTADDSGLVETPESKPKPKRAPRRKPKPKVTTDDSPSGDQPEAAE